MQWNGDRNAGFSTAIPAKLYSPVIMDPVWGYEAINVEAQQDDPSSLLSWMRNMIALRKLFAVFGRGGIEFLDPSNRKILAYLRKYQDEQVLCVANLSRFAQPVDLDLSKLEGMTPVEMLGYVDFPVIEKNPYRFTMAPYSFLWLELQRREEPAEIGAGGKEQPPLDVTNGWADIFEDAGSLRLETVNLPEYFPKQRWFAGKSRTIQATRVVDWVLLDHSKSVLAIVEIRFESGAPDLYLTPLAMAFGEAAEELQKAAPNAIVTPIVSGGVSGVLHDGVFDNETCSLLFSLIEKGRELDGHDTRIFGVRGSAFQGVLGPADTPLPVRRGSAEQSNTSILYGDRFILKLFRHLEAGLNPDAEIGQYLTEKTHFNRIPPFAGSIEYGTSENSGSSTLAMLQGLVANEGDGWKWTLEELNRYFEARAPNAFPEASTDELKNPVELSEAPASQLAKDHVVIYLDSAATLGRRTAELHMALASPTSDPAFLPEPMTGQDLETLLADLRQHASSVLDLLKERVSSFPDEEVEIAASVLIQRRQILDQFKGLAIKNLRTQRIRIHGDYHLGQVLKVKTDFVILDFEGEPARSLAYRRAKQCPLKDVAGMLRSFSYAVYSSLINYTTRHSGDFARLEPWARLWEHSVAAEFLRAYRETARGQEFLPSDTGDFRKLLDIFLLDKALYEVLYEMNSRPAWVRIPLLGILSLQP
jgi:maltose alpha-D-glucosyltransferase / alpha-amylase